ncbi:hypothetical protein BJ742DRAFT_241160 [Cladochytrium replicatum]|nr:hypothetical protein BJ742DRAFT_241160 [Cladochytrium replicatum]
MITWWILTNSLFLSIVTWTGGAKAKNSQSRQPARKNWRMRMFLATLRQQGSVLHLRGHCRVRMMADRVNKFYFSSVSHSFLLNNTPVIFFARVFLWMVWLYQICGLPHLP